MPEACCLMPISMTPAFEKLQKHLKQLPGLGYRSAERIALNLLVEQPERLPALVTALQEAARRRAPLRALRQPC